MLTVADSPPLIVLPLGMDNRKLALLQMAFRMHQAIRYQLAEAAGDVPTLAIVDVDSPQGWDVWQQLQASAPTLPALIVSAFPVASPPAPVLAKPIRVETLFPALQQLLAEAARSERTATAAPARPSMAVDPAPAPAAVIAPVPEAVPAAEPLASVTTIAAPARSRVTAPPASAPARPPEPAPVRPDVVPASPPALRDAQVSEHRPASVAASPAPGEPAPAVRKTVPGWPEVVPSFDPNAGLYGQLRMLYQQRRSAVVSTQGQAVLRFYPAQERCELLVEPATLMRLCTTTPDWQLTALAQEEPSDDAQTAHAVLWRVALWSARGRLPDGLDPNRPLRLRHWPNLTRLAPVPDAMRMAAFWTRTPASARTAQRMLGVAVPDMCNFLAACLAIELLDTQLTPATRSPAPPLQAAPDAAGRSLLSRLLARLRGV